MAKFWLELVTRVQCTAVAVLLRREQRLAEGDKLPPPPPPPYHVVGVPRIACRLIPLPRYEERILYYPWFK